LQGFANTADNFVRITVKQVISRDRHFMNQALQKKLAKAGRMSDRQPDVLIEVKHSDPLPVYVFRVGQRVKKIQLGRSRSHDDSGATAIEYGTAQRRGCLFGGGYGVVMVVYLHEALNRRLASGKPLKHEDVEQAVIEGAVQRLRPKLMTVCVVLASLVPILWESGIGSDVMKPIAEPLVGGMITSTIHVLILVPVFFALMKERALRRGTLRLQADNLTKD